MTNKKKNEFKISLEQLCSDGSRAEFIFRSIGGKGWKKKFPITI